MCRPYGPGLPAFRFYLFFRSPSRVSTYRALEEGETRKKETRRKRRGERVCGEGKWRPLGWEERPPASTVAWTQRGLRSCAILLYLYDVATASQGLDSLSPSHPDTRVYVFLSLAFYSRLPFTRDKSSEESPEFLGNGMICGENFYGTRDGMRTIESILHLSRTALAATFNTKYGRFALNDLNPIWQMSTWGNNVHNMCATYAAKMCIQLLFSSFGNKGDCNNICYKIRSLLYQLCSTFGI